MPDIHRRTPLPADALAAWLNELRISGALDSGPPEQLPVADVPGRIAAADLSALWPTPSSPVAAMDGWACRAHALGDGTRFAPEDYARIDTGDALPDRFDRVVKIEDATFVDDVLTTDCPTIPGQHVRGVGEDVADGALLATAGQDLSAYDAACLAAGGHAMVAVHRRPRVIVIPTGDELLAPGETPSPGRVTETNGLMLAAAARALGADARLWPRVPDDPQALTRCVASADADLVLLIAGTSRGRDDHAVAVLTELGTVTVHGVAARPGHPVILARVGRAAVIGVPGYPLSAACTFERFAVPLLTRRSGRTGAAGRTLACTLAAPVTTRAGVESSVPIRLADIGEPVLVGTPLPRRAGATLVLAAAHAILTVPPDAPDLPAGTTVEVELLTGIEPPACRPGSRSRP